MRFHGIYAPLTTPFDHRGTIYWSKFDFNLSQLLRTNLSGFVVADRWGEAPLLSSEEKVLLWRRSAALVGEAAHVIATVSGCGVEEARALCEAAAEAGCSAALLEAPNLSPRPRNGNLFFQSVADSVDMPVLVALRSGSSSAALSPDRLADLSCHPRIAGAVMEGHGEAVLLETRRVCQPGFCLITRDLSAATASLSMEAGAALLTVASVVPFHALSIEEAIRTRNPSATSDLVRRAWDLDRLVAAHGVPALKAAQEERSFYGGSPRLPLLKAEPSTAMALAQSLSELAS